MVADSFDAFADEVRACRACRLPGEPKREAFAEAVGVPDRPPEVHDGPGNVDILVVGINPKLWPDAPIPLTRADYLADTRKTMGRPREVAMRDKYVRAIEQVLPDGYSWWNRHERTVGNTRMCKCPTHSWQSTFNWAAAACTDRFLERELRLLMPKVLLVLGVDTWGVALPLLGITKVPQTPGPHLLTGATFDVPIVAAHHLSRKGHEYRSAVRAELEKAIGGVQPGPAPRTSPSHGTAEQRSGPQRRPRTTHSKKVTLHPGQTLKITIHVDSDSQRVRGPRWKLLGSLTSVTSLLVVQQHCVLGMTLLVSGLLIYLIGRSRRSR